MAAPTANEIRASFLTDYGISVSVLSDTWIEDERDYIVIPFVERITGMKFTGEENITEYLSGTGEGLLMLSRKNVTELVSLAYVAGGDIDSSIGLGGVQLLNGGIIKAVSNITEGGTTTLFRRGNRNIKVVYKVGESDYPNEIKRAISYLVAESALGYVGAATGGGSINVQGFGRNFGERGKFQDARNDYKRRAMFILNSYKTHVVGSV